MAEVINCSKVRIDSKKFFRANIRCFVPSAWQARGFTGIELYKYLSAYCFWLVWMIVVISWLYNHQLYSKRTIVIKKVSPT